MKLLTWNINSVRLRLASLLRVAKAQQADVICLQETKAHNDVFPLKDIRKAGYEHILIEGMKAYNGVAILSRLPIERVEAPNWCAKSDCRHLAGRLSNGVVVHNFYVPAGGDIPDVKLNPKFAHKLEFVDAVTEWFGRQKKMKCHILVGDLNIAPLPEDVWSHTQLLDVVSHTPIEIEKLGRMQDSLGWVDAVRTITPAPEKLYSWWSYRADDWLKSNRGRRLDHIWLTPDLAPALSNSGIYTEPRGWEKPSDHAPVWADLSL